MFVPFIVWPGETLAGDPADTDHAFRLLELCELELGDAAIALELFRKSIQEEDIREEPSNKAISRAFETARRVELRRQIVSELAMNSFMSEGSLRIEANKRRVLERIAAGEMPLEYIRDLPLMYARNYVFSLDTIIKCVNLLSENGFTETAARSAKASLAKLIPDVSALRNSLAHVEDRIRGLGRKNKQLDLQAVSNSHIHAPAGVVFVSNIIMGDDEFASTIADGRVASVRVSEEILRPVQGALQAMIDALVWGDDHSILSPSY